MKSLLIAIVFSGASDGGVHSFRIDFNSEKLCVEVRDQLRENFKQRTRPHIIVDCYSTR